MTKFPGGSSTRWTLKSYDKGNSFTYTGPGFPTCNVIIGFNFLVQTLKYLKQTCSFRILLCLNLLSIDDPGTAPNYSFKEHLSFYFPVKQS